MTVRPDRESAILTGVRWTAVDGLKVRYVDEGRRNGPDTLMLAPSPAGLEAFGLIWPAIVESGRVVAIDLPGTGSADGRTCLMSARAMAAFVIKVIEALRLRHPHLAAADLLTATALFTALDHPGAVESLILSEGVMSAESRKARCVNAAAFEKAESESWSELSQRLDQIEVPTLIIIGPRKDSVPTTAKLLSKKLPRSRVATVDGDRFNGCDVPPICVHLIDAWVGGQYRSVGAAVE